MPVESTYFYSAGVARTLIFTPSRFAHDRRVAWQRPVRVSGDGPETIVLVCDAPVFIEHYDSLFALLVRRYRVVCMELPGMGFSVPTAGFGFTLAEQAEAVEQVLRALDVKRSTLAFPCVDGYLALLCAAPDTGL